MATIYKRYSLNLHYFKDDRIIKWIEAQQEETNLSYSDIIRLSLLEKINGTQKTAPKPIEKSNENKKPKFKIMEG